MFVAHHGHCCDRLVSVDVVFLGTFFFFFFLFVLVLFSHEFRCSDFHLELSNESDGEEL